MDRGHHNKNETPNLNPNVECEDLEKLVLESTGQAMPPLDLDDHIKRLAKVEWRTPPPTLPALTHLSEDGSTIKVRPDESGGLKLEWGGNMSPETWAALMPSDSRCPEDLRPSKPS